MDFSCGSLKFIMFCTYPPVQFFHVLGECGSLPSQVRKTAPCIPTYYGLETASCSASCMREGSPCDIQCRLTSELIFWCRILGEDVCLQTYYTLKLMCFPCKWSRCIRWAHLKPEALPAVSVCTVMVNMKPAACSSRDKAWLCHGGKSPKGFPNLWVLKESIICF